MTKSVAIQITDDWRAAAGMTTFEASNNALYNSTSAGRTVSLLSVRRVERDEQDEIQIELQITEIKGWPKTRIYIHGGNLTLTAEQAAVLAHALLG